MIFDEATSVLDNISQSFVKKTIFTLLKNNTIIVVAHTLSMVDSDNIVFMENGKIEAEGTHNKIMKTCKKYHDMYIEEDINENSDAKGKLL